MLDRSLRRAAPSLGPDLSPIAFGSAPVGILASERDATAHMLNWLLDSGVNVIDTAAAYMGAEELIGHAIGHRRSEFLLVTKCGADVDQRGWHHSTTKAELLAQIDRSLTRLRTDVIDVVLIHSLSLDVLKEEWPFEALSDARRAGKIRFGGYSGDGDAAEWAIRRADVAVLQTSLSLVDQRNLESVLPIASQLGKTVLSKRSIANACWRAREDHYERYHAYVDPYRERFAAMGLELARVAPGITSWAELAIRFTLSFPQVQSAIVGSTSTERMREILHFAAKGALPETTVDAIREAFQRAQSKGGSWEART